MCDSRAAPVKIITDRFCGILTIHNPDREPCTAACDAEKQSGEPAASDQELHIVDHGNRMEPVRRTVQVVLADHPIRRFGTDLKAGLILFRKYATLSITFARRGRVL